MCRKIPRIQPGHLRPLLQDGIDRLRIDRPPRNRAPSPDARSRRSRRLSVAQVASSFARTSPVTALALLRRRCLGAARIASRMADLRAGEAKAPSKPRHLVSVDQFASRRRRWLAHEDP
jgi:hypothetical protein